MKNKKSLDKISEKVQEKRQFNSSLEESLKDKVLPLLEETMEKSWGITIPKLESDISDRLKNPQLSIYINTDLKFSEAKKKFKSEFLKRELRLNRGNISQSAKKLGVNRRSIHRAVKDLKIDLEDLRTQNIDTNQAQQEKVDRVIRSSLDQYKTLLQPHQMEKMYQQVESLSRNISKFIPQPELSWKDAEQEFEKQFLSEVIKDSASDISKIAKRIKIRPETLYRKIKKFGLKKN